MTSSPTGYAPIHVHELYKRLDAGTLTWGQAAELEAREARHAELRADAEQRWEAERQERLPEGRVPMP